MGGPGSGGYKNSPGDTETHSAWDIIAQDPESGWNALHRSLYSGNVAIARALLAKERADLTSHTSGSHSHVPVTPADDTRPFEEKNSSSTSIAEHIATRNVPFGNFATQWLSRQRWPLGHDANTSRPSSKLGPGADAAKKTNEEDRAESAQAVSDTPGTVLPADVSNLVAVNTLVSLSKEYSKEEIHKFKTRVCFSKSLLHRYVNINNEERISKLMLPKQQFDKYIWSVV